MNATEKADYLLTQAKERSAEKLEDTVDIIRRNPGKTVAISVVVGIALGALIVNSAMKDSEPQATLDDLSEMGKDAWENVKCGAEAALDSARAALNAWSERFSK